MTTSRLDAQLQAVAEQAAPTRLALMLYGSLARGTADAGSDVDVLELVAECPSSYRVGRANITQYVPSHLFAMATQGSLFVLHLRQDGVVLLDDFGTLGRILDAYSAPATYSHIWEQLSIAAGALDPSAHNFTSHVPGLARLGIYILRTAAYVRAVELGKPEFDSAKIARVLNDPDLGEALAMRRQDHFTSDDVKYLRRQIERIVRMAYDNPYPSVEAYIVAHSGRSDLASLFAAVLQGESTIEYSTLTLPPF